MVVTDEPRAAAAARVVGAVVLGDAESGGLNAAVAKAARCLADDGRKGMLVVPADVPLVTAADVDAIVGAHRAAPSVTLVPAESDGGTNAFACSPPLAVGGRFGEDSLREHRNAAMAAGIAATILRLPRIGCDIDRPDDLVRFLRRPSPTRSYAYLVASGIAGRLRCIDGDLQRAPVAEEAPP
jgi:2-phospho-L-lactate guanylyltransferase